MKYIIIIIFCSCFLDMAHAQSIFGMVQSQNTPIAGASVLWKNHGIGTVTNIEGKFMLLLSETPTPADSIVFSCIGYAPLTINAEDALKNKFLNIQLKSIENNLSDVSVRTLSLQNLLDSIENYNVKKMLCPAIFAGYYKETVYSDSLCTEFSDALCEYYFQHDFNKNSNEIQLKINASRCLSSLFKNTKNDRKDLKISPLSDINPNKAFQYALLYGLIDRFFPKKVISYYKYKMEEDDNIIKITVSPKQPDSKHYYELIFLLKKDFTLQHFHLEIPLTAVDMIKPSSLLGIHIKCIGRIIDVNYLEDNENIYLNSFSVQESEHDWGKMLGSSFDETFTSKSEFVTTTVSSSKSIKKFNNNLVYKGKNICGNGVSINDSLLAHYNMILPTQTERTIIKGMK